MIELGLRHYQFVRNQHPLEQQFSLVPTFVYWPTRDFEKKFHCQASSLSFYGLAMLSSLSARASNFNIQFVRVMECNVHEDMLGNRRCAILVKYSSQRYRAE
jgi:hypothetical protein